jgi:hypothetical protein
MDDELEKAYELAPEPFDPTIMDVYKSIVLKELNGKHEELARRDQELANKVATATFEQIREQIESDWACLAMWLNENTMRESCTAAKDTEFLRNRRK